MRMKNKNYTLPLALVFSLFFLWAISSNLLPTMIRQLMKTCELNTFEASFTVRLPSQPTGWHILSSRYLSLCL